MLSFCTHMFFSVHVLELTCLWSLWLMYMRSMIIPHLALFIVMIPLGEISPVV